LVLAVLLALVQPMEGTATTLFLDPLHLLVEVAVQVMHLVQPLVLEVLVVAVLLGFLQCPAAQEQVVKDMLVATADW
jgi:hypothetical protein